MQSLVQKYHPDYDISSGQRIIRNDGSQYDVYFPKADAKDKIVFEDGEVEDTIKMIERVVWTYIKDTKKIATILSKGNTEATLRAIWEFLYYNIQYKLDKDGLEQLRRPARAWMDRISGIDCDCFSIFCSSILCNLGIPHSFRITKYSKAHWQHIYVIVPKANNNSYWTVDAVLGQFNYEKPFTQKMDYPMSLNGINIAVLSGFNNTEDSATQIVPIHNDYVQLDGGIVMNQSQLAAIHNRALNATLFAHDLQGLGLIDGEQQMLGAISNSDVEDGLYKYLLATRQAIAENPATAMVAGYNQQDILKMLDYAIHYWYSDKREMALGQLILNEQHLNQMNGLGALGNILSDDELYGDDDILLGDDEDEGLGKAKRVKAQRPTKAVKKAQKAASPKPKQKGFFKKVGNGLKKVGKGIVRFNPATIAARNGFLLALKTNVGKLSEKLKWAYATPQQAQAKRVSPATIGKAKNALAKIEKLFTKIGGKPDNLRKAILSSKKGRLNGLGAAPAAAAIAAATPIIVAAINAMKSSGLVAPNEQVDITTTGDDEGVGFDTASEMPYSETSDTIELSEEPLEESNEEFMEGLGNIGNGIIQFTQNNPMLGIAVGGTIAYGIYHFMNQDNAKSKTKSAKALAGTSKKKVHHFKLK
jgi:hypothetical protein